MLPFEATCADCQLLLSTRVHKKWSLSQRGSESLSLGGAEIGMYVNKCILVKNILIGICHVELEEHQSSFQGKSVVRWNVWAGITQSGKSLGVAGGGGGGKATRQMEEQMQRQRYGLTWPFGEVQLAWWYLEQGGVRKEEIDGDWLWCGGWKALWAQPSSPERICLKRSADAECMQKEVWWESLGMGGRQ